ncbi:MAG: TlpA family protein disulfide reductase [Flavobacteriales bacterium]|nr:TlpA family protein disulfide reductase [Flavobacteriales bacterium]
MNKIKPFLFFIAFLFLLGLQNPKKTTPNEITNFLSAIDSVLGSHHSFSYDLQYKIKYCSDDDTTSENSQYAFVSAKSDTLLGATILLKYGDSMALYYNFSNLFSVNHSSQKVTRYPEGNISRIEHRINRGYVNYFLGKKKFADLIDDNVAEMYLSDTSIDNVSFFLLTIHQKDQAPVTDIVSTFLFDSQFNPVYFTFRANLFGGFQYDSWKFTNLKFDQISSNGLADEFQLLTKNYPLTDYQKPSEKEKKPLLTVGEKAPDFWGYVYPDSTPVRLSDKVKEGYVLLDFWYMSCYPCIMAIPHLSDVSDKYKDKGLTVWGVNPYNGDPNDQKKFPKFLDKHRLIYPIVFVDEKLPQEHYGVDGYPTFFLVGKGGTIEYVNVGYGEKSIQMLDSIIDSKLMK